MLLLDHRADRLDGFDDVLAGPLGNLQGHGLPAVDAGEALRVLERTADVCDVAEPDHGVAVDLDRHRHDVGDVLEQARHLDREPPLAGVLGTGGHQQVAVVHDGGGFADGQAVALDLDRIDEDFDHLVAVADDLCFEDAGNPLDGVLKLVGQLDECPLGHVAGQDDQDHREQAEIDLVDGRLVGVGGKFRLGQVDPLADVVEGRIGVEAGLEFHHDAAAALVAGRAHFLDALDGPQFLLHRPDQQAFGVLGRDALVRDNDIDDRYVDVG